MDTQPVAGRAIFNHRSAVQITISAERTGSVHFRTAKRSSQHSHIHTPLTQPTGMMLNGHNYRLVHRRIGCRVDSISLDVVSLDYLAQESASAHLWTTRSEHKCHSRGLCAYTWLQVKPQINPGRRLAFLFANVDVQRRGTSSSGMGATRRHRLRPRTWRLSVHNLQFRRHRQLWEKHKGARDNRITHRHLRLPRATGDRSVSCAQTTTSQTRTEPCSQPKHS